MEMRFVFKFLENFKIDNFLKTWTFFENVQIFFEFFNIENVDIFLNCEQFLENLKKIKFVNNFSIFIFLNHNFLKALRKFIENEDTFLNLWTIL